MLHFHWLVVDKFAWILPLGVDTHELYKRAEMNLLNSWSYLPAYESSNRLVDGPEADVRGQARGQAIQARLCTITIPFAEE